MKKSVIIFIIVVLLLVVGGGIYYSKTSKIKAPTAGPTAKTANNGIVDATILSVDEFLKQYNSISSETVNLVKKVTNYASSINASGENIAHLTFVKDEADDNIIYFADQTGGKTVSLEKTNVYRLNLRTNELRMIYETDMELFSYDFRGRQGQKLLFEKRYYMDSPGPCWDIWAYTYKNPLPRPAKTAHPEQADSRTIKSLDLDDLKKGFSDFVTPKQKGEEAVKKENECTEYMRSR